MIRRPHPIPSPWTERKAASAIGPGRSIRVLLAVVLAGVLGLALGCSESPAGGSGARAEGPARVVVTIPPLRGLVAPLLPADAEITVLVEPGLSVHGYEPTPEDIVAIARADAVVMIGMGLEAGVADAVRHGGSGATLISMAKTLGIDESHAGHDHAHDHGDHACAVGDPHLWLDPVLAESFVRALPGRLPEWMRADAEAAASGVGDEIATIDDAYRERLAPFAGRAIVTHHASYARPAERYGLTVAAVLRPIETLEPSPGDLAAAREAIAAHGVGAVFVEPQFSGGEAERLAEAAGVELIVLDPLGDGDWFGMMRTNLDRLVEGLSLQREAAGPGGEG
jgi:zinc transport system substrate-binding protein